MFSSFNEIIAIWPKLPELAAAVGASHGATLKWKQRGIIPPEYWPALISAAERRGHKLTTDNLTRLFADARLPSRGAA